MIRVLSLYGPQARFGGGEHHARVVPLGRGKRRGKHSLEKPAVVILLGVEGDVQHAFNALAGSFQYAGHRGAHNVASRFRVAGVAMGPKARKPRFVAVEYDADHAWMEVISTFV